MNQLGTVVNQPISIGQITAESIQKSLELDYEAVSLQADQTLQTAQMDNIRMSLSEEKLLLICDELIEYLCDDVVQSFHEIFREYQPI